jgi:hypothetical protein
MEVLYAVEWVEIDFGRRPEGYKVFSDKEVCVESTKKSSIDGPYSDGGYCGPVRPLHYYEIPPVALTERQIQVLKMKGFVFVDDLKYKSDSIRIQ